MRSKRDASRCVLLLAVGMVFCCHAPAPGVPATSTRGVPDPYFIESAEVTRSSGPMSITRAILQDRTV